MVQLSFETWKSAVSSLRVSYEDQKKVLFILLPGKNSNSWAFVDGLFGVSFGKHRTED